MAKIKLDNVTKRFGDHEVVKGVSLEIEDGEFAILVGPSGCGKSTTLRMIAGLEEISSGDIHIGDRLVNHLAPKNRDIAMVFQEYALYPHMTVRKNLAFGLKMRGFAKEERDPLVEETAALLGIGDLLERKPRQLSGGQRQRVALGRAIVRKPQAFLFDEPLSNLDAKLRVQMRAELKKLHHRLQTTMVYVTHDQVEAMTMGTKIVIMNDGLIQQVGRPMEVYLRPVNRFVAGFIGSPAMNFFPARLAHRAEGLYVEAEAFRVMVPESRCGRYEGQIGREVVFGIRPEDVYHLRPEATLPASVAAACRQDSVVCGEVEVVEPLGSELLVIVKCGQGSLVCRLDPGEELEVGQPLSLALDLGKMHLFDGGPPHQRLG